MLLRSTLDFLKNSPGVNSSHRSQGKDFPSPLQISRGDIQVILLLGAPLTFFHDEIFQHIICKVISLHMLLFVLKMTKYAMRADVLHHVCLPAEINV